jgi:hypothetical protein
MPVNTRVSAASRNAGLDALLATIGASGKCRIYDGTQPTDPDTALGAQVMLSDHALSATAFGAAAAGTATANAIGNATAAATGTASWGSFLTSANVRKIDFSVGTATSNLIMNSVAFSSGATISITSFTASLPMQGT